MISHSHHAGYTGGQRQRCPSTCQLRAAERQELTSAFSITLFSSQINIYVVHIVVGMW